MTYISIGLVWLLLFAIICPVIALLAVAVTGRRVSVHDTLLSGDSFFLKCFRTLFAGFLAVILAAIFTYASLTSDWLYAPADLEHPVSWFLVLVPAGLGGALGVLLFEWACHICNLAPAVDNEESAG